ncbi:PKHD-type hydroxylase [Sphingomonas sp. DBB INV C78]|uniref:Fe2+-dependent dioxygenase n=1 Tax=Sphingomonas sp. DBB INV C78 TaxID=3349434 RepID=UPI0036D24B97
MFRMIEDVLPPEAVAELVQIAATSKFVDGRVSNPHSRVKNNTQLHEQGAAERVGQVVARALLGNREFFDIAFPKAIAPPILARYEPQMNYGLHPDAAMMQTPTGALRSDLSCTVFLNDPASYDGGALRVQLGSGEMRFKGRPGSAVVYPSMTLHEVEPVTRGQRLVAITFIQSRIADPVKRDLLYELNEVAALEGNNMLPENFSRLQAVQFNLMRRWTDHP